MTQLLVISLPRSLFFGPALVRKCRKDGGSIQGLLQRVDARPGHDLNELRQATGFPEAELRRLVAKSIRHYEEYYECRRSLVPDDGPTFFSPSWCNSFENAFLWIGDCRPSMFIRLLYSLSFPVLELYNAAVPEAALEEYAEAAARMV
ncbi:protein DOG1-like 2 [Zingiber officinale]|uniref:protein DOG1-like 2 n=1 Tax=Zingiber officinale TaxID=94328 RepID=UPI001C4B5E23|nr:protein DOG1-like 2 [Zingiber officinale]